MLTFHNNTIQVYSVTVMTHVKALQSGQSSQGTSEPITPGMLEKGLFCICFFFVAEVDMGGKT